MRRLTRQDLLVRVALGLVALFTVILYLRNLGEAPMAIGADEARFGVHGHAVATTARDNNGTLLPVFFHITNPLNLQEKSDDWWQPLFFYMVAAFFRIAPASIWLLRLPIVCLAVLNVWLIFLVGRRFFSNPWYGVLAAALLVLTPAHFLFGREAMDYFCPLPFALAWLWGLERCVNADVRWVRVVTGLLLGVGLYSHIMSWIVMPTYLAVTLGILWWTGKPLSALVEVVAGFAMPLLPALCWITAYPDWPRELVHGYKLSGGGLHLVDRLDVYWDYFNPSYLFFAGGSNPMFSTRRAGVFLLAGAVLLPAGIWSILRRPSPMRTVLLVGFMLSPLPVIAALPKDPKYYTPRHLLVVPFGVLIMTAAVEWLIASRDRLARVLAVFLLLTVPLQFVSFARYYFTEYQTWSAPRFDPLNLRGAVDYLIGADGTARAPAIYLSEDVGEGQAGQWLFYLLDRRRPDIWARSRPFIVDQINLNDVSSGSLLIVDSTHPQLPRLLERDRCSVVHVVKSVTGEAPASTILRRN